MLSRTPIADKLTHSFTGDALTSWLTTLSGDFDELCDMYKLVRDNLTYSGRYTPELLQRTALYREAIKALHSTDIPAVGHACIVKTKNGTYENAIVNNIYEQFEDGKASICMNGSAHISSPKLNDIGLPLSISGGYFHSVGFEHLQLAEPQLARFWFWGAGACANGGIYISEVVPCWLIDDTNGELGFY